MERIIKNKENCIWFAISFVVLCVVYGSFFKDSFIMDHIASENAWTVAPPPASFAYFFAQGRATTWLWTLLYYKLGVLLHVTKLHNSWPITLAEIAALSGAMTLLHSQVRSYFEKRWQQAVAFVLILLAVVNPLYQEYFVYYAFEIAMALLMTVAAARAFKNQKYLASFIWMLLAIWTYQNFFELFFVWASLFILLNCDLKPGIREVIEFIKAGCIGGGAVAMNLIGTKVAMWVTYGFGSAKIAVDEVALAVTGKVITNAPVVATVTEFKRFWTGDNPLLDAFWSVRNGIGVMVNNLVMPTRLMLVLSFMASVGIITALVKKKVNLGSVILTGLWLVFINCCYLIIYLSGIGDYSGRITWIFFGGVSTTLLLCLYDIKDLKLASYFFSGLWLVCFVVVVVFTWDYSSDFFTKCEIDRENVGKIAKAIEEYETESGKEVTKISVVASPNMEYASPELKMDYSLGAYSYNCKTYNRDWSDVALINVLTGVKRERLAMTEEEFNDRFSDYESWNAFDITKQLKFEGDTLYWAKF